MWFLYIVECSDNTFYTGISNDVLHRVQIHNENDKIGAKYTKLRRPVVLKFSIAVGTRGEATKLERKVKKLSRIKKMALIESYQSGKIVSLINL